YHDSFCFGNLLFRTCYYSNEPRWIPLGFEMGPRWLSGKVSASGWDIRGLSGKVSASGWDLGGLVVRSRLRCWRVQGSKPDSTEDQPCIGPVAP
ncbi:hypothetical protein AVEN_175969-1, partial [Araneus ventricosus]